MPKFFPVKYYTTLYLIILKLYNYIALKKMPCKRVMLLTGTPIQNNTEELFTLLNYIEPSKFPNVDDFKNKFGELKTKD